MAPEFWIIATLCAASFQTIRFTLQKILADGNLSPLGATYSRFIFAAPWIVLFSLIFLLLTNVSIPDLESQFLLFAVGGDLRRYWQPSVLYLYFNLETLQLVLPSKRQKSFLLRL